MVDFVEIKEDWIKKDECHVKPEFITVASKDLMIKGQSFYAVWNENIGLWSRDGYDIQKLIDPYIRKDAKDLREKYPEAKIKPLYLRNFSTKKWSEWMTYTKALPDNYEDLDQKITFQDTVVKKEDYVSKRLPYSMKQGEIPAYEELISTLYEPEERKKLEWAIGSIIAGDSKHIQKFVVLYGEAGSGKSTVLNIVQDLFEGYYSVFDAKTLGSNNNSFALEMFKNNPLIAIQHDGDLSRIEDNTKLNSIVSHETISVNEKFKAQYSLRINSFLFMGTNRPVKITDAKSGILRRLIDVSPSGKKVSFARYNSLMERIKFELGGIAYHCLSVYKEMGASYYNSYRPFTMIGETNPFYNFIEDNYEFFSDEEGVTLSSAWEEYKKYVVYANVPYPYSRQAFKAELKNYFSEFKERSGGKYKLYLGFRKDKFDYTELAKEEEDNKGELYSIKLDKTESLFDTKYADLPAQEADKREAPRVAWDKVTTKLKDIDTRKLHYVFVPENLIVIDFDIKDESGKKDPVANLEAASKWPPTYTEYSKSGGGIHLHYIYEGDVLKLNRDYGNGIEIKVFKNKDGTRGHSTLRRKLSFCNDLPIAVINSGLTLLTGVLMKGENVQNEKEVKSEAKLRQLIARNLNKEIHCYTKPSVEFIFKILEDAYAGPLSYDVSDLRQAVLTFAAGSSNNASYCISLVSKMKFRSRDMQKEAENFEGVLSDRRNTETKEYLESPIIFFDVEVFPNLLVICWKYQGTGRDQVVKMINPTPEEVKKLFKFRLVGFNNRRYDNHIIYAASLGYTNKRIYEISRAIVTDDKKDRTKENRNCFFGAAYNLSYTDIYDFSSKKQSLKKFEIELGIHHQELGLPWDEAVPEELWEKVADYCVNDVMATEAVFNARKEDFVTRKLLADLSGLTVNDPNRAHIIKIIVGDDKNPRLVYTDFATGKTSGGNGEKSNYINTFPGYECVTDERNQIHNMYRGVDLGRGGYVYAEPGMYTNVALLDVGNMHGASIIALNKFGEYTKNYAELREARMAVKHHEFDRARNMLDGKLNGAIDAIEAMPEKSEEQDEAVNNLQSAIKLVLNSTYGIAAASFPNPLRDQQDVNNIIALRGALFMKTLQDEVVKRGFKVIHVKTDSIKVPDATDEIISYIFEFGKKYGYEFEHECTYEKFCLVNDAVYIAKYDNLGVRNKGNKHAGEWTATGAQFAQSYVFKTLFSKEPIKTVDLCETKETSKGAGLYLDMNEGLPEGEHDYRFIGRVGQFCPILPGKGGGVLVRDSNGKYDAVVGTKKDKYDKKGGEEPTYRWLESEYVNLTNKWIDVDHSYYMALVEKAKDKISEFGDFEWFVSDEAVKPVKKTIEADFINIPDDVQDEEVPF